MKKNTKPDFTLVLRHQFEFESILFPDMMELLSAIQKQDEEIIEAIYLGKNQLDSHAVKAIIEKANKPIFEQEYSNF